MRCHCQAYSPNHAKLSMRGKTGMFLARQKWMRYLVGVRISVKREWAWISREFVGRVVVVVGGETVTELLCCRFSSSVQAASGACALRIRSSFTALISPIRLLPHAPKSSPLTLHPSCIAPVLPSKISACFPCRWYAVISSMFCTSNEWQRSASQSSSHAFDSMWCLASSYRDRRSRWRRQR